MERFLQLAIFYFQDEDFISYNFEFDFQLMHFITRVGNTLDHNFTQNIFDFIFILQFSLNKVVYIFNIIQTYKYLDMTSQSQIDLFENPFHISAQHFNNDLQNKSEWKLRKIIRFPFHKFIMDGDKFFQEVWSAIDNAKDYFWITTYAMDSSPAADTTLYKLIDAAQRGVHVILFIDNVQSWAKKELIERFRKVGGKYMILNPQYKYQSIYGYFTKDVWRRHHEKLIVSDNKSIIGSSNIEGNYAGIRYGNSMFRDINFYSENIVLDEYRKHFIDTANQYHYDLKTGSQTQEKKVFQSNNANLLQQLNKKYENSQFYPIGKYKLLHNDQRNKIREIQQDVMSRLKSAKTQIKIIQPYHYSMSRFERQMQRAITKKKLKPEIITSGKRDQPVFQQMKNQLLFERLLVKGTKLYETKERLLHSKIYMFDKRWISLGSMNNDRWSWLINNECNITIDDQRIYDEVNQYYESIKKTCHEVKRGYKITADQATSIHFWQWFLYLSQIVMSQYGGPPQEDYIE